MIHLEQTAGLRWMFSHPETKSTTVEPGRLWSEAKKGVCIIMDLHLSGQSIAIVPPKKFDKLG
jgi:hypothetical protein